MNTKILFPSIFGQFYSVVSLLVGWCFGDFRKTVGSSFFGTTKPSRNPAKSSKATNFVYSLIAGNRFPNFSDRIFGGHVGFSHKSMCQEPPARFSVLCGSIIISCLLLISPTNASARQRFFGYCAQGGIKVVTQGLNSTNPFQRSYASCTVRVYISGTVTLATLYSDNLSPISTPLSNPFTANTSGYFEFYATGGRYDVQLTDTPSATTFTWGDVEVCDPLGPNVDALCVPGGVAGLHNLLSTTHPDTVPASPPTRGDLITGQNLTSPSGVTPAWGRLALGSNGKCLVSNGTDAVWDTCPAAATPPALPFLSVQWNNSGVFGGASDFTWDDANNNVLWGSGSTLAGSANHQWILGDGNTSGSNHTFIFGDANTSPAPTESAFILGEANTLGGNSSNSTVVGLFNNATGGGNFIFGQHNSTPVGGQIMIGQTNTVLGTSGGDVFGSNNGFSGNATRGHIYGDVNSIIGPGDDNHAYGEANTLGPNENIGFAYGGFNILTGGATLGNVSLGIDTVCGFDASIAIGIWFTCPEAGVFIGADQSSTPNIWITNPDPNGITHEAQLTEVQVLKPGATVTINELQCPSGTSLTAGDCGANPTNWLGISVNTSGGVAQNGMHLLVTAGDAVVGHTVCAGADSPKGTDSGGTTACANGTGIGIVMSITERGAATRLPLIWMARN